jgi:hypothetical protein
MEEEFGRVGLAVSMGTALGKHAPEDFACLGVEFLDVAKAANATFQNSHAWPIYYLAFQSLEDLLKAYLIAHGTKLDVQNEIRHNIRKAFDAATNMGLVVDVPLQLTEKVLEVSKHYANYSFRYRTLGSWCLLSAGVIIEFVEAVRPPARQFKTCESKRHCHAKS